MNTPSCPSWPGGSKISRLWSAKGDERCFPPESDDYKDWSLMQLKREITQRQLKTNPRRRNKDAFVRVLLQNDQEQTKDSTLKHTMDEENPVMFIPTSTSELQSIHTIHGTTTTTNSRDQQEGLYGTNGEGRIQHQQEENSMYTTDKEHQQLQDQIFAHVHVTQAPRLVSSSPSGHSIQSSPHLESETLVPSVVNVATAHESEVESFQVTKRQRMEDMENVSDENEMKKREEKEKKEKIKETMRKKNAAAGARSESMAQQKDGKKEDVTEYWKRKLSVQAARFELESRRLDLELKREQRKSELHAVQLALAQEQLQQAEITTQKMKTEWMVEQMIQKKRLNDANISHNDSAALGMYLS
ncbi:unnamed protein product [Peronospora belbahrii]|uniref:Uncharacterized protein n=1 Tax=Peronospora belbahrii TaxID=622444 RepID=A0AAU9L6M9_9STRA|nr:unnamed protein product [Peronospora belbahrii]CAH0518355.1 unnamed protein product [Peronospora belbahrii]